jgi:hypothetical protein
MLPGEAPVDQKLIDYLLSSRDGETFIVAGPSAPIVAPIIIETGLPAMALGGFGGRDNILTRAQFADAVASGEVRFVLAMPRRRPGMGLRALGAAMSAAGVDLDVLAPPMFRRGGAGRPGRAEPDALDWVREECRPVPPRLWRSPPERPGAGRGPGPGESPATGPGMMFRFPTLYDCKIEPQSDESG